MRETKVGLGPALGKDFANSFGPCLVTADEIADPHGIAMQARINGEVWSSGTLGAMRFSFAEIVSHISQEQPLVPGDVLGSGTVGGGCGLELDRWIRPRRHRRTRGRHDRSPCKPAGARRAPQRVTM